MLSWSKINNLTLRGLTVGIRFLFAFYLGKRISLEMLGDYSLWTTTIAISLMFLGFDFYTYSTREILKVKKEEQWSMIRDHGLLILVSYFILLPILSLIFLYEILNPQLLIWFFAVLVTEHLGAELYRLFNTLQKPVLANFLLLVRSAAWMVLLFFYWSDATSQNGSMEEILRFWFVGGILSVLLGLGILFRHYRNSPLQPINKKFIRLGIQASGWLILGTLALKTIELSDRYMIDHFLGKEDLGIFSFYYQITNLINVVIYTVVIVILYPKLFKALFTDSENVRPIRNMMLKQSLGIFITLSIGVVIATPMVIEWMNRPLLNEHFNIVYWMLISVLLFNLYLIYKLFLNALGWDMRLLLITAFGALVNFMLNWVTIPEYGIEAASVASAISYFLLAMGTILLTKKAMAQR